MRRGYTLIEILIALSMMVILLGAVGFAIRANLRVLDESQTETAEARLARAVLEKIARDIRNAVVAIKTEELEVDAESLQNAFFGDTSALSAANLTGATGSTGSADSTGTESTDGPSTDAATGSGDASGDMPDADGLAGTTPGIYGDLEWMQIDTARMPRGEQFGGKVARSGTAPTADRLSPSKTVLYYLGADTASDTGQGIGRSDREAGATLGALGRSLDRDAPKYGLFRREKDRFATQYMVDQGLETEEEQYDESLAPEVEAIEFLYFDAQSGQSGESTRSSASGTGTGGEWIEAWDMDEIGYLPKAIRVTVWIRRLRPGEQATDSPTERIPGIRTIAYSLIVPLPVATDAANSQ